MRLTQRLRTRATKLAGLGLVLAVGIPTAAQADLLVYATNPTVAAGGSGSFDIVLESTADSGGDYHVGAFNTNIQVPIGEGISFTAVDQNTTDTYIFSGNPGAPTLTTSA